MSTNTYTPKFQDTAFTTELHEWIQNISWEDYKLLPEDDPRCTPSTGGGWATGSVAGPNHPSRLWHKERPDEWVENCREGVLKQWEGERGKTRKKDFSNKMKNTWKDNRELMVAQARKNGNHGLTGKDVGAVEIEYYGKTYWGWKRFMKETRVSKHLYKKYYMNGINPEYRIGKNGPEAV